MLISISGSSTLFHITSVQAMSSIAKQKSFTLKPSEGTQAEVAHGQGYYLSCARSVTSRYFKGVRDGYWTQACILVLDGAKLAARYKVKPVDYWQAGAANKELEDRVWSPTQTLSASYITEVHLQKDALVTSSNEYLNIYRWCLQTKTPLYVYENSKDMAILRRTKSVKVKPTKEFFKARPEYRPGYYRDPRDNPLRYWIELWMTPVAKKASLSDDALWRIRVADSSSTSTFNADLHNAKAGRDAEKVHLAKIVNIMRLNKLDSKSFLKTISDKWR